MAFDLIESNEPLAAVAGIFFHVQFEPRDFPRRVGVRFVIAMDLLGLTKHYVHLTDSVTKSYGKCFALKLKEMYLARVAELQRGLFRSTETEDSIPSCIERKLCKN